MDVQQPARPPTLPLAETPKSLVMAAVDESDLDCLTDIVRVDESRLTVQQIIPQHRVAAMGELPEWLNEHPDSHLLMAMPVPSVAIARLLDQGVSPSEALAAWISETSTVLQLVRPRRRRTTVVLAELAFSEPQAIVAILETRLRIPLAVASEQAKAHELPGPIMRMMAENAIRQSAEARTLSAELEVTALPLPQTAELMQPAVDHAFADYQKSQDRSARERSEIRQEKQILESRLEQLQDEFKTKLAAAEQTHQRAPEDSARIQDLQEENDLLLQQLHHVQEELERYYLQSMHGGGPGDLQERLHAAEETIQALYNSKSWKITRPLRALLDAFTGGNKAG